MKYRYLDCICKEGAIKIPASYTYFHIMPMHLRLFLLLILASCPLLGYGSQALQYDCRRVEKGYMEDYVLVIIPASKAQPKAKLYLDGRDLDQSDAGGHQEVKSIIASDSTVLMSVETRFDPELIEGVSYSAGTVFTQMTLNRATGQLKKIETIRGGILGATVGEGTTVHEERCAPSKLN